jgi:hypothetical protein
LALENHYLEAQKMNIYKLNSAAGADKIWPALEFSWKNVEWDVNMKWVYFRKIWH